MVGHAYNPSVGEAEIGGSWELPVSLTHVGNSILVKDPASKSKVNGSLRITPNSGLHWQVLPADRQSCCNLSVAC